MKIAIIACAAAALLLPVAPASADHRKHSFQFADALFRDCQSDVPALRGMCLGYLAGIADAVEILLRSDSPPRRVCDPATVSIEDYRRALIGFLKANPQHLGRPSSEVVAASLSATWPCKG